MEIGGTPVAVQVKSVVDLATARVVAGLPNTTQTPVVVAADRIGQSARDALHAASVGYFDRRGQLRLVLPNVIVDTSVRAGARPRASLAPLSSATSKEVALLLLERLCERPGVRKIARILERAPSSISLALDGLKGAGLVTSAYEPIIPELFRSWRPSGDATQPPSPQFHNRSKLAGRIRCSSALVMATAADGRSISLVGQ